MTHPYCTVALERAGKANVVTVSGEIDLFVAPALGEALDRAAAGDEAVVVDLSACTFMDSNGLHALLEVDAATDRLLVARTPDGVPERLLALTAPDRFAAHPTREAALGTLA